MRMERISNFEKPMQWPADDPSADGDTSAKAGFEGPKPNSWAGVVVAASKTLATDKEQMQSLLNAWTSEQNLYGYPTKDLQRLIKQLDKAKDLQEFLTDLGNGAAKRNAC